MHNKWTSESADRSWYSVLPVLDTTGRRHVKKAVVCVAQLVAGLIMVHGLLSFLPDVYGLFDPSGKMLWLSVDHHRLRPVDDMVLLSCVVGESGFVVFCSTRCVLFCIPLQFYVPVIWLQTSFQFHRCRSCHSWHGIFPSCQEPEELSTNFFSWRPLTEVETSSFR